MLTKGIGNLATDYLNRGNKTAYNKGIAASRAGRCYLLLWFAISFGFGRTSIAGLLFIIFYFYNFILQRLGADLAMNSMPAAIPDRWAQIDINANIKRFIIQSVRLRRVLEYFKTYDKFQTFTSS